MLLIQTVAFLARVRLAGYKTAGGYLAEWPSLFKYLGKDSGAGIAGFVSALLPLPKITDHL